MIILMALCITLTFGACGNSNMSSSGSGNDIEALRAENKQLKEENKELQKQIANLDKGESTSSNGKSSMKAEDEYIAQSLELTSAEVKMCEGYSGREPGLVDVSIKNNGDRNISELTITAFFQDENGNDIAEDSFMVIGGYFGGNTLKANYSWKMASDEFYEVENLSDEVDINRCRIEITDITFE